MNKKILYKVTFICLLIDQIIKIIVNNTLTLHETIKVIPNFFSIYYVKNTGAAFSILKDNGLFLIILSTLFIIVLNRYIEKEKNLSKKESILFGLIMGGVLGNLMDRIIHRGVIDYLSFTFFGHDFAVFNFADSCIVIGIILYIINSFIEERKQSKLIK